MNFKNDEDVLDFINRLLERLHQAGFDQQGSHFQFVYVQACTQQTLPIPPCLGRGVESSGTTLYPAPDPAPERGGELVVEERIRRCIGLLMAERYGNEPLFNLQGHWQAVYRILVDKGYCRESDFDGFDVFVRRVMPEKVNKPYRHDSVRNINKTDFNKPFTKWHYSTETSGNRIPYERMVAVASRFSAILEDNGL
jgi:hypothetical protein